MPHRPVHRLRIKRLGFGVSLFGIWSSGCFGFTVQGLQIGACPCGENEAFYTACSFRVLHGILARLQDNDRRHLFSRNVMGSRHLHDVHQHHQYNITSTLQCKADSAEYECSFYVGRASA